MNAAGENMVSKSTHEAEEATQRQDVDRCDVVGKYSTSFVYQYARLCCCCWGCRTTYYVILPLLNASRSHFDEWFLTAM